MLSYTKLINDAADRICKAIKDTTPEDRIRSLESGILGEIVKERAHQIQCEHGGDTNAFDETNSQNDWVAYICAYAGRAANKVARNGREGCKFRENMIKVAALAAAAVEAYDKQWCPNGEAVEP